MNFKTTYILFAILTLVLVTFAWVLWVGPANVEQTAYVLPSMHKESGPLDPKDITRVEIERKRPSEQKLVFVRDGAGERWRIAEPRDYRADSTAIDNLVRQIYNARLDEKSDVVNKPEQYGLETPAEVITLRKTSEPAREVKLYVGEASPGKDKAVLYVTSSDRKEVMAVKKAELDSVKKSLDDFRSRDLLSPAAGDIQALTLAESNKDKVVKGPIELKKGTEDRWTYIQPPYGDAQATGTDPAANDKAPSNVQSVTTDISNLKVDGDKGFVKDDVKDLGEYHLDPAKDEILRIEIERVEEIAKDAEGNKEKKTAKVALLVGVGAKVGDDKDQYYAYIDDPRHKDIVTVSVKSVARLLLLLDHKDALRDRNLVALGNFRKPDAIDIKNSYGLLEFRRTSDTQKPWKLWRGDKSYTVDEPSVQALLTALTAPSPVESFPEPSMKGQLGLDKPDITLSIWADSLPAQDKKKDDKKDEKKETKPEPKEKDKPAYTLAFGFRKENAVAVERRRGGEKTGTIVMIPAKVLDQVREGPLAYLDKEVPSFNATRFEAVTNVTKLALTRDGTTYEISHEDKAGAPWKIDKPSEYAGRTADRTAVEDILRDLNNLRFVKIVEDKIPADARLAELGLKEPRLKAVVTLTKDGKPRTFEYSFGKEADDKSGVYLRTSLQDTIGIVAASTVTTLQRELLDPTVFQFDVAKVKEVRMTGWIALQKKIGSDQPFVLDVKRDKNGTDWVVEKPSGFKLDAEKLRQFLTELSHLKATKYVAHKSKPAADQELDVAKGALQIDITVEGEKEPLQLTVGKQDGEAAYFAISNKQPGDILDVRKDLFDGPRSEPGYFGKK
jgi:hypothetical protein